MPADGMGAGTVLPRELKAHFVLVNFKKNKFLFEKRYPPPVL